MSREDDPQGISIKVMTIGVMILITYFCWAIAASAYFGALFEVAPPESGMGRIGGRSRGIALFVATIVSFLLNSVRLNHAPGIISNTLQNEQWIVVMFALLMGAAILFGLWVKKLEAELAGPKRKTGRKRRNRKRRTAE